MSTVVTEQVGASADDCSYHWNGSAWVWSTNPWQAGAGWKWTADLEKIGAGFRFQTVAVPNAATIITAYLTITAKFSTAGTVCNTKIRGEDTDDAAAFSTEANYQGRHEVWTPGACTTAVVSWNAIDAWTAETEYNSPEIKTIIQEIVDRGGWATGQDMVLFWDDHDDLTDHNWDAWRCGYDYDQTAAKAAKLYIEYEVAAIGACVQTVTSHLAAMRR